MKGLINRITKWWNDTEIDSFSVATVIVFIGVIILFALNITEAEKLPSKDEICQKHFGKDYVWHEGYRSVDFCVGDSGIPKYPKSWR
jgi:hypothetical protein|nr:MAG TPA: hypothetical protein [Caudoviricetes sp.]